MCPLFMDVIQYLLYVILYYTILYYTLLYNTILYYTMNKIKRQKKKGDSYKSQWEVNIKHIMA